METAKKAAAAAEAAAPAVEQYEWHRNAMLSARTWVMLEVASAARIVKVVLLYYSNSTPIVA